MPSIDLGNVVGPKGDKGDPGPQGLQGIQGIQGPTGYGVIPGGAENSFLLKNSAVDYDTKWMPLSEVGSNLVKPDNPVGAALSGKASNPNLLDNWYFADPINQRGETEYIGKQSIAIYTIDRWFVWNEFSACCTISVVQDGLKFTVPPGCHFTFNQRFPKSEFIANKIYTSSYIKDGNIVYSSPFVSDEGGCILAGIMNETNATDKPIEFTVSAAKLELGPVQTLAHQDVNGNWVLNDPPPNYALEMAKCQRYQVPLPAHSLWGNIGYGFIQNPTNVLLYISLPTAMRIANPTPTTLKDGPLSVVSPSGSYTLATGTWSITLSQTGETSIVLSISCDSANMITGEPCFVQSNSADGSIGGIILLDENL